MASLSPFGRPSWWIVAVGAVLAWVPTVWMGVQQYWSSGFHFMAEAFFLGLVLVAVFIKGRAWVFEVGTFGVMAGISMAMPLASSWSGGYWSPGDHLETMVGDRPGVWVMAFLLHLVLFLLGALAAGWVASRLRGYGPVEPVTESGADDEVLRTDMIRAIPRIYWMPITMLVGVFLLFVVMDAFPAMEPLYFLMPALALLVGIIGGWAAFTQPGVTQARLGWALVPVALATVIGPILYVFADNFCIFCYTPWFTILWQSVLWAVGLTAAALLPTWIVLGAQGPSGENDPA